MRFIVPHPGHFAALKEIIEVKEAEGLNEVEEVYMAGAPEVMGSGRATLHSARIADIKEQTAYAHQHDIKMNIVINPSCFGGYYRSDDRHHPRDREPDSSGCAEGEFPPLDHHGDVQRGRCFCHEPENHDRHPLPSPRPWHASVREENEIRDGHAGHGL